MAIIICMRHPDYENAFQIFGEPEPEIIDVDYGRMNLDDEREFSEWRTSLMLESARLKLSAEEGSPSLEAAKFLDYLIAQAEEDYGQGGGES